MRAKQWYVRTYASRQMSHGREIVQLFEASFFNYDWLTQLRRQLIIAENCPINLSSFLLV